MGLDWVPLGKPKPGYEEEYEKLFNLLSGNRVSGSWSDKFKNYSGVVVRRLNVGTKYLLVLSLRSRPPRWDLIQEQTNGLGPLQKESSQG